MRRFLHGMALAAALWAVPAVGLADDRSFAEQIAGGLRSSGQLVDYSIGVKFEGGTAWLQGRVANDEQARKAMELAEQFPFVERVVNQLEVRSTRPATQQVGYHDVPTFQGQDPVVMQQEDLVFGGSTGAGTPSTDGLRQPAGGQTRPAAYQGESTTEPKSFRSTPAKPLTASRAVTQGGPTPVVQGAGGGPIPSYVGHTGHPGHRAAYNQPAMPGYAWPAYASYPNYGAVTYPQQYSATAWPYIGPFYPYPQVPLGWRRVSLEWDDGWWFLEFHQKKARKCCFK